MTKVFVTGANSKQANPLKSPRDVTVAWMIAEACRDLGYDVEHGSPAVERDLKEFDHVFCGLAPMHALGASRIYGAVSTFIRAYADDKLTMYVDDWDLAKIVNGSKTMETNEERFTKPFFVYRKEYEIASQPQWKEWLMQGVRMLNNHEWPQMLIPSFSWRDESQLLRALNNGTRGAVYFDPSAYMPTYVSNPTETRELTWVTESLNEKWLSRQRPSWHLQRYGKGWDSRPGDQLLVERYAECEGVLDEGLPHGWWHSRLGYAMQARSLYATTWQNVEELGEPFVHLPDTLEEMTPHRRREVAHEQAATFAKHSMSKEEVRSVIERIVEHR